MFTHFFGGIKRLSQRRAGGFGDTKICIMTTIAIRKDMRDDLETNRRRPASLDDIILTRNFSPALKLLIYVLH
jgi:hypothetical protein